MKVKINGYVTESNITEAQAIESAKLLVSAYDITNEGTIGEELVTKLYYIVPTLGRIIVVVNDHDRDILGVDDNILANTLINEYPLIKLPASIVEYKELIIKSSSTLTDTEIMNAAQAIANEAAEKALPFKTPVVKVINYRTNGPSKLVMSSIFNGNTFLADGTNETIFTDGDAEAGSDIITGNIGINLDVITKTFASDGATNDRFGWDVAMSDSKIIAGATHSEDSRGGAYIYDIDGTNEVILKPADRSPGDYCGYTVDISSSKAIVGAYGADVSGTQSAGKAYLYDLDGSNEIVLTAPNVNDTVAFGTAVAISDTKAVVTGVAHTSGNGNRRGAAYVYDLNGTLETTLEAPDGAYGDFMEKAAAISNSKIVLGAKHDDDDGDNSGSIYIFDLDGTNVVKVVASDAQAGDEFGTSVAVSDTKIVVGARAASNAGGDISTGAVYIYDLDGTNEIKISPSDGENGDSFGLDVSISDSEIVVGSPANDAPDFNSGAIYIYDLDGTNERKVSINDTDSLGSSVDVSGSKLISSSISAYGKVDNTGAAYIVG